MERIIVRNISKKFRKGVKKNLSAISRISSLVSDKEHKEEFYALNNISFTADAGEIIGIIGSNGSGKSTLLRIIAGIYKKDSGAVKTNGKMIPLINLRAGMQDRLSMKDNIFLCCSLFGLTIDEIRHNFAKITAFAELEEYTNTKLFQFSEGMKQRLAFSMAIHSGPEILLIDEVFEVGDESFRNKSANRIKESVKLGATVLLVSHNLDLIKKHCDKVIWIEDGKIIKEGMSDKIIREYITS
ncbi:ABC transporter ATP-binding protein [Candidatus Woesearchaeota archaeon]|nr:ABC transporter ATP-binding protein [Candidatus Woesearchaeota archaeon]